MDLMMYYNLYGNRDKFSKLINFSSGAETCAPDEPYGKSKKIISESVKNTDNFFNMKIYGLFDENELDTRFIKSNIIRYIKKEPMIIHTNKVMDFFYMKDLIYLVRYYLYSEEPVSDASCSYKEKYSLLDVAKIINEMDTYTVPIHIENKFMGEPYRAEDNIPPGDLIGLRKGIEQTYRKLWRLYYEYSYSHGRGW
jgi:nucleoside-diphosphate-sugar epimerase